jgi:tripartite-type tricarboxylate transporter receptor subunit TctC
MLSVLAGGASGEFPERPLRFVVPFAPGGGSDFVARLLASRAPDVFGQNAVVDNRPGGASLLATQLVAKAPNDGYTLLLQDLIPFSINHALYSNAGYDPIKSFSPVAHIAAAQMMMVVPFSVPANTLQEFVVAAKAQPGKLAIGNAGTGSVTHLAAVLFTNAAGVDMTMVPYKGTGPALTDVVAGRVHAIVATGPAVMPLVKGGKLRVLAAASEKRLALIPEVPTMREAGLKDVVVSNGYVMITAANTPPAILNKLHDGLVKIVMHPEISARMTAAIIDPMPSANPQELAKTISSEMVRWGRVVKTAGIRVE